MRRTCRWFEQARSASRGEIMKGAHARSLVAASLSAVAADLPPRPAYQAPAMVAPVQSWTGCYVGGNVNTPNRGCLALSPYCINSSAPWLSSCSQGPRSLRCRAIPPVRETLHGLMVSRDLMIQKNPGASRKTSESTKKLSKRFRKRGRRTIHGKASAKNRRRRRRTGTAYSDSVSPSQP